MALSLIVGKAATLKKLLFKDNDNEDGKEIKY